MPIDPPSASAPLGCLSTLAMFVIIVSPLYLLLRFFVRLIRAAYGFDGPAAENGPPLRICDGCHNTVLERDFQHCPYCGRPLQSFDAPSVAGDDAPASAEPLPPASSDEVSRS